MNRRELQLAMVGCCLGVASAWAAKPPILTCSGRLQRTNDAEGRAYEFTEEEFLSLPQSGITTGTTWTPVSTFTGPALAVVLAHVKASGETIRLSALNDYRVDVPWTDLAKYSPVLAHSRDGRRMAVATHGPLWLIYPRDQFADELGSRLALSRFIWQVYRIDVR